MRTNVSTLTCIGARIPLCADAAGNPWCKLLIHASDDRALQLEALMARVLPDAQLPEGFVTVSSAVGLLQPIGQSAMHAG